jgi:hypothetical protein
VRGGEEYGPVALGVLFADDCGDDGEKLVVVSETALFAGYANTNLLPVKPHIRFPHILRAPTPGC